MTTSSDPRAEFSEWLHAELVREAGDEPEQWARDRVARVQQRLNHARAGKPPLETTILQIAPPLAFTLAGRYVYISRRLLERMATDDAVALVLAHEAAHHDLGHFELFKGWGRLIPKSRSTTYLAMLAALFEHHTYGPALERR